MRGLTENGRKTSPERIRPCCPELVRSTTRSWSPPCPPPSPRPARSTRWHTRWRRCRGRTRNPATSAITSKAITRLASGLRAADDPAELLCGAWLAASAFAAAGSGVHHKLCHVLGGTFDLPHARTHAVVLPHVLAFNALGAPEAVERIAHALGTDDALTGLRALAAEARYPPRAAGPRGCPRTGSRRPQRSPHPPFRPTTRSRSATRRWCGWCGLRGQGQRRPVAETGYSPGMTFADKMSNKAQEMRGRIKRNAGPGHRRPSARGRGPGRGAQRQPAASRSEGQGRAVRVRPAAPPSLLRLRSGPHPLNHRWPSHVS